MKRLTYFLAALVPVWIALGVWWGGHPSTLPGPLRDVLVSDRVSTIDQALEIIHDDYYRRIDTDRLVDDSLAGAVQRLDDRFSAYLSPSDYSRYQRSSRGEFSGVGMEVSQAPRGLRVSRVFRRAPAARAGIRRGDLVVAVDGRSLAGKSSSVSSALIRGRPGTSVTLTVISGGHRRDVGLRRARVTAPAVESSLRTVRGRKLGVVALAGFTVGAHGEVRSAVDRLLRRGAKGIVLDLRGNGGGILDEAVLVSSVFIPDGTLVTIDGRTRARRVFKATGDAISGRIPVVVLVDHGSASASEIVAGAIQDRHRGKVVGTRTFGKGVFQEVRELDNGGALEITVGEYFLPSGRNIGGGGVRRGGGIRPDVAAGDRPATRADEGLQAALRTLAGEAR